MARKLVRVRRGELVLVDGEGGLVWRDELHDPDGQTRVRVEVRRVEAGDEGFPSHGLELDDEEELPEAPEAISNTAPAT